MLIEMPSAALKVAVLIETPSAAVKVTVLNQTPSAALKDALPPKAFQYAR